MNKKIFALIAVLSFTNNAFAQDAVALRAMFKPLPEVALIPKDKIELGKKLYNDKSFSLKKDLSCNSCHDLGHYGVDNQATSPGHNGQHGDRNSPTVYNAALHIAQFWDGRAADVEAQALGPVLNPVEMAMPSAEEVVKRIKAEKSYAPLFAKAFPGEKNPITFVNFGKAIGAFERTLLTPSKFDAFLKGDDKALNADELKGLQTFVNSGCTACHNGATLGGQMYQKLGLLKPYQTKDEGKFKVTKNEADKFFFKVPSLRNVAKTGPYFHDGSVQTLEQAISIMGEYQLGKKFTDQEVSEIKSFLDTLTGELPK